jgi:hypothetical protein
MLFFKSIQVMRLDFWRGEEKEESRNQEESSSEIGDSTSAGLGPLQLFPLRQLDKLQLQQIHSTWHLLSLSSPQKPCLSMST